MGTSRTVTINVVGDSSGGRRALDELAEKSESVGSSMGRAFDDVLEKVNRVGILGEFGDQLDGLGRKFDGLSLKAGHLAETISKIGAAGIGLGAWLTMIGSEGASAKEGLAAAVNATDESWADWSEKMESAAKKNEQFAFSTKDSYGALTVLTAGLHDPKKALDELNLVTEMASFKHTSLSQAAQDLVKGLNGSTKIFRSYGLAIKDTTKEQTALAEAQRHLTEVEDGLHAKRHITKLDLDHEVDARQKVAAAQKALNEANAQQAGGKTFATPAAAAAQLEKNLAGQPEARVAGGGGQIKKEKTKVQDWFEDFGEHHGGEILSAAIGASLFGGMSKAIKKILNRGAKEVGEGAKDAAKEVGEGAAKEAAKKPQPDRPAPKLPPRDEPEPDEHATFRETGRLDPTGLDKLTRAMRWGQKRVLIPYEVGKFAGTEILDHTDGLWGLLGGKDQKGDGQYHGPVTTNVFTQAAAQAPARAAATGSLSVTVHNQINLDGRVIAQQTAVHTRDHLIDSGQNMSQIGLG